MALTHKERIQFQFPVYKDQTDSSNAGKLIEVGDTITVKLQHDSGALTDIDLTVTGVFNNGKGIEWNRGATDSDVRTCDIARVHAKHQYRCPGRDNYRALNVSVASSATVAGITLGGVNHAFAGGPYGAGATSAADAQAMEDAINVLLNDPLAYATVVVVDSTHYAFYLMNTNAVISGDEIDATVDVALSSF